MKPTMIVILFIIIIGVITTSYFMSSSTKTETITEYINTTKTITETVIVREFINTTAECNCPDEGYISRLLRDYNRCKSELDFWNRTDALDINYDLNVSLTRCNQKVEDLKELI